MCDKVRDTIKTLLSDLGGLEQRMLDQAGIDAMTFIFKASMSS